MACSPRRIAMWSVALAAPTGSAGRADWPMAAHDPQRTSWAAEEQMPPPTRIVWMRKVERWIPTKAHVIIVAGEGERPDMVFVPTAAGVYALRADTGADVWAYAMPVPVHTKFNEGATSHFYDVSGTFNATALALKLPQAELSPYLDSPLVQRGDLYYIQNLVSALEAGR